MKIDWKIIRNWALGEASEKEKQEVERWDVRTEQEYAQGHVPGALLLPIQTLREHMGQVPADGSVLLLCRTGRRAETAYDMIREAYPQKKNLWFLKGIPVYGNDGSFTFK